MNNSVDLGYMDSSNFNLKNAFSNIFQSQLLEIQYLLSDINNYASKINRIIYQINNIMSRIDISVNSKYNAHINKINNYVNIMNKMDMSPIDFKYDNYYSLPRLNDMNYDICFKDESGNKIVINSFNRNRTINELINYYLIKKGEHFLVDNYDDRYNFRFDGKLLNNRKNMKSRELGLFDNCYINVLEKK